MPYQELFDMLFLKRKEFRETTEKQQDSKEKSQPIDYKVKNQQLKLSMRMFCEFHYQND